MSVSRVIRCDRLDCEVHARTDHPPPHLPVGFIEMRQGGDTGDHVTHACGWPCAMVLASCFPPDEFGGWLVVDGDDDASGETP